MELRRVETSETRTGAEAVPRALRGRNSPRPTAPFSGSRRAFRPPSCARSRLTPSTRDALDPTRFGSAWPSEWRRSGGEMASPAAASTSCWERSRASASRRAPGSADVRNAAPPGPLGGPRPGVKVSEDELLAEVRAVGADEWEQAVADAERDLPEAPNAAPHDERS